MPAPSHITAIPELTITSQQSYIVLRPPLAPELSVSMPGTDALPSGMP